MNLRDSVVDQFAIRLGTDHPFSHFNEYNVMVDSLDCSESDRELINHGNAERLLGL